MKNTVVAKKRGGRLALAALVGFTLTGPILQGQEEEGEAPQELVEARQEIRQLQQELREARAQAAKYRQIALKNREIALKVKAVAEEWQQKCAQAQAQSHEQRMKYKQLNTRLNRMAQESSSTQYNGGSNPSLAVRMDAWREVKVTEERADQKKALAQAGSPPNFLAILQEHYPADSNRVPFFSIRNLSPPELVYYPLKRTFCWLVTFDIIEKRPKRRGNTVELIKREGKGYAFFQAGGIISTNWGKGVVVPTYHSSTQRVVRGRRL
jgi:hypothetical protein